MAAVVLVAAAGVIVVATRGRGGSCESAAPVSVARSITPPQARPTAPDASTPVVPQPPPRETATVVLPKEPHKAPAPKEPNPEELKSLGETYEKNGMLARDQRDFGKAKEWFLKAAAAGNNEAMRNLGVLYQNGQGGAQDLGEAMKWYSKAADAGNSVAKFNIGRLYQSGLGVTQDNAEAKIWYSRSALLGYTEAKEMLRVLAPPPTPPPAQQRRLLRRQPRRAQPRMRRTPCTLFQPPPTSIRSDGA